MFGASYLENRYFSGHGFMEKFVQNEIIFRMIYDIKGFEEL